MEDDYAEKSLTRSASEVTMAVRALIVLIILSVVAATGAHAEDASAYPTYTIRYRLTVSAYVSGKTVSASNVVELRIVMRPKFLDAPPWKALINGEATFVDLGEGRNLVALLNAGPALSEGTDIVTILFHNFGLPVVPDNAAAIMKFHGERLVQPHDWPAFVTFQDPGDSLSVKKADPKSLRDLLDADVRIESVRIAVTEEPVTRGLERQLPWLSNIPQYIGDPKRIAMNKLHLGLKAFIQRSP